MQAAPRGATELILAVRRLPSFPVMWPNLESERKSRTEGMAKMGLQKRSTCLVTPASPLRWLCYGIPVTLTPAGTETTRGLRPQPKCGWRKLAPLRPKSGLIRPSLGSIRAGFGQSSACFDKA